MKTEMDTEKDLFEIEEETAEDSKADQGEKKTESKSKTEDASKEENEPVKDAALAAYHTEKEAEEEEDLLSLHSNFEYDKKGKKKRIQSFRKLCKHGSHGRGS